MADPLWSDAGAGYPPVNPPTVASVLGRYLAEVPDPNLDWPGPTAVDSEKVVRQWVADGVQQFFQLVFEQALATESGKAGLPRDHAYVRQYLTQTSPALTTSSADVALPTDSHLLLDVILYPGASAERIATEVPFSWDYRIKEFPSRYGPDVKRPLFAVKSSGAGRLYVAGAIPANMEYAYRYIRTPKGVYDSGSGVYRVDCPDQFLRGPIFFAIARWAASRDIDPAGYLAEFEAAARKALPIRPKAAAA